MNDYKLKKQRLEKKLNRFIKDNTSIAELSIDEIKSFIIKNMKTINRSAYYTNIKLFNEILKDNNSTIQVNSKMFVDECVQTKDEQLYTKRQVQDLCNSLLNFQDKAIVYLAFNKITGKAYSDLLNLKVSDVAEDYSCINVNGKKIMCDEFMKYILEGTIKADTYYKFVTNDTELKSKDYYEFNMSSPYLIKAKPSKLNCDGLNPLGNQGLQRKLTKMQEIYKEKTGEDLIVGGVSLVKSGIMYDMFIKEVEEGKTWEISSIDEYLKMNGYKMNPQDLYRSYWEFYHDSKVAII